MTILLITSLIANVGFIVCIVMMLKIFAKVKSRLSSIGAPATSNLSGLSGMSSTEMSMQDLTKLSTVLSQFAEQYTTTTEPEVNGSEKK